MSLPLFLLLPGWPACCHGTCSPAADLPACSRLPEHLSGCVDAETVAWVREQAARLPRVPSLALVHIPLPQFLAAWNRGGPVNGSRPEAVGCPGVDSGLFEVLRCAGCPVACMAGLRWGLDHALRLPDAAWGATRALHAPPALLPRREAGINAVLSGHDHGNDYCARLDGVRLCYGRKSG